jgi:POT family proton-dependent oligopeptide transporter
MTSTSPRKPWPEPATALASAGVASAERTWFGHPPGLTVLFFTEMWEKFSFYGMRALLIYYMVGVHKIPQGQASLIYGLYTGGCYLTPILGGYLADRWLGRRNAVLLGGLIMAAGHFLMTFDSLLFPALATIATGNGLFLPCLGGQIRDLYSRDDPRLMSAFNVYYVGVNLGAFLAPLVCGAIGELIGWRWGFAAAGIGMVVGVVIFSVGARHMPNRRQAQAIEAEGERQAPLSARRRLALMAAVIAIVIVFRAAYEQGGNTIALWAQSGVDRNLGGGWSIPMTWFQSLNPLFVFLLTPLLLRRWAARRRLGRETGTLNKMAIGAALLALSYLMIAVVAQLAGTGRGQAHWSWLVLFFLLYTLGELFILPVGLGLFGRLSPGALAATGIAAWFLASFVGNLLAGAVGVLWSSTSTSGVFVLLALLAAIAAALMRFLARLMPEVDDTLTERDLGR